MGVGADGTFGRIIRAARERGPDLVTNPNCTAGCPSGDALRETLSSVFGMEAYREGQEVVCTRLVEGKSVLTIFPTGGGKSLCYQLPAMLLDGLTVVISPLIALMKDQLDFLTLAMVCRLRALGFESPP